MKNGSGSIPAALLRAARLQAGARRLSRAPSVEDVLDFLVRDAIPRFEAEHEILYPALERALGRPGATAPLDAEHAEIRTQTERLESLAQQVGRPRRGHSERLAIERIVRDLSRLLLGHLEREATLCAEARAAEPEFDAGWEALAQALEEAERRALSAVVLVVRPTVSSQTAIVMRHNPAANRAYAVTLADLGQDGCRAASGERARRSPQTTHRNRQDPGADRSAPPGRGTP